MNHYHPTDTSPETDDLVIECTKYILPVLQAYGMVAEAEEPSLVQYGSATRAMTIQLDRRTFEFSVDILLRDFDGKSLSLSELIAPDTSIDVPLQPLWQSASVHGIRDGCMFIAEILKNQAKPVLDGNPDVIRAYLFRAKERALKDTCKAALGNQTIREADDAWRRHDYVGVAERLTIINHMLSDALRRRLEYAHRKIAKQAPDEISR